MEQSQATGAIGGAAQGAATGAQFGGVYGAVIGGVIGGVAGFLGGGGEKDAKKAARAQAAEIMRVARENRRIQTRQAVRASGEAKARTYASNIQEDGSALAYRKDLENEYRAAIANNWQAAQMTAATARTVGDNAATSIKNAGVGQAIGGLTSFGSAYAGGAFSSAKTGDVLTDKAGSFAKNETSSSTGYISF